MRALTVLGLSCAVSLSLGLAPQDSACDAIGDVQFICGIISPEDLAVVPGEEWIIASGDQEGGRIHLVNVQDKTATVLFPTSTGTERLDVATYPTCPGPIDPQEGDAFRAHGLYLTAGSNRVHRLYVVHHGFRESIEVFEVDARGTQPTLTWVGCVVAPEALGFNSVVALPGAGRSGCRLGTTRRRRRTAEPPLRACRPVALPPIHRPNP